MKNNKLQKIARYLNYLKIVLRPDHKEENRYHAFKIITKLGKRVLPDYRFTYPDLNWWNNKEFNKYLDRFDEVAGFNMHRRWMLKQLSRMTAHIGGDTVECGAYRGSSSWLILQGNEYAEKKKMHHIFDSFQGLSNPGGSDGSYWTRGDLTAGIDELTACLAPYVQNEAYMIYQGWIPERFHEIEAKRFSLVHVDVDLYQPTYDSIAFFYQRLEDGGVFVCDDYGFSTCPGATRAIDEFLTDKKEKVIALPDGGGFFIKGVYVRAEQ